jgi:hypothetical protein
MLPMRPAGVRFFHQAEELRILSTSAWFSSVLK